MKKIHIILIVIGLLVFLQSNAQITFENSYSGTLYQGKVATKGNIYYMIDTYNYQCLLYNPDHSIWKTIEITAPQYNYIYDIQYISQNLFNDDELVEIVVVFFEYIYDTDSTWYYSFTTKVINENGNELLTVEGGAFPFVYNTYYSSSKLFIYIYDYSITGTPLSTEVYHLPGELLNTNESSAYYETDLMNPFPNPTTSYITIPYSLESNMSNAELILADMSGKRIKTYQIDQSFNNLKIDTEFYKPGIYIYWIEAAGYKSQTKKFIIE